MCYLNIFMALKYNHNSKPSGFLFHFFLLLLFLVSPEVSNGEAHSRRYNLLKSLTIDMVLKLKIPLVCF